jgi:hypothetical protein
MASLIRDTITVPGQNYALLSFVGPNQSQKTDKFGLKIRGCFNTEDEAKAHVKRLMETDPLFDVYLVNMNEWLLIPPDTAAISEHHYQEEYLETLVQGYKNNQVEAKKHFEERKQHAMLNGTEPEEILDPKPAPVPEPVSIPPQAIEPVAQVEL